MFSGNGNGIKKYSSGILINNNRLFAFLLFFLSLLTIFCYTTGTVSADPSIIYVNNNTGNDSWDGQSQVWNGTSGPKLSIKNATGTVLADGTVNIANGTYFGGLNRNITIDKSLSVVGGGFGGTVIDGELSDRLFTILDGCDVTISGLQIINGYSVVGGGAVNNTGNLTVNGCSFTNNHVQHFYSPGGPDTTYGGAIYNTGTLNVVSSTFTGNQAYDSCLAGAIYSIGNLNVRNSSFVNNAKEAIMNAGGNLIVENSQFINNAAYSGSGGAICSWGSLEINRCSFINNTARMGGAIQNGGSIVVLDSEFVNNSATNWEYGGRGGAIDTGVYSTVEYSLIDNCTFTGNSAYTYDQWHYGGAVYNNAGNLTIANCTFNDNVARGYGGAIFNQAEGNLTVAGCNFFDNFVYLGPSVVVERGGNVLYNSGGHVELHFNRIIGSGDVIGNRVSYRYVEAQNNWWGSNNSPGGKVDDGVHYNPWIVFEVNATSSNITSVGTSVVTANLVHNSNGTDTSIQGLVPVTGMSVSFTHFGGLGILNPENTVYNDINLVTSIFTAVHVLGVANVTASFDGVNSITQILINSTTKYDIYISTSGNDTTGDGTPFNPYFTINKGVSEVYPDGIIHIANGIYREYGDRNILINKNMTIQGESQDNTIIDAEFLDGIFSINGGLNVTIKNLTFVNGTRDYGGAINSNGTLSLINCTFTNNTASSGGAINNNRTLIITNCNFTYNMANDGDGGGINNNGTLTVTSCSFTDNTANCGGAIKNCYGTLDAHFNRFYGNIATNGQDIYLVEGTGDINNNWWGNNSGPSAGSLYNVNPTTWLVFNTTVSLTKIPTLGASTVFVDLTHDNIGTYYDPVNGHVPYGIPVGFTSILGSVCPVTTNLFNGVSTCLFTAGSISGLVEVNSTVDGVINTNLITVVNGADVYVSTTGNDITGDGSQSNPFQTILTGVSMVSPGGNLHIDNGTYFGGLNRNITIDKSLSVVGGGFGGTVIDGELSDRLFTILDGCDVTISGLQIINGYSVVGGGAVNNTGNLTVNGCSFTNNHVQHFYSPGGPDTTYGGAIYNTGTLNVVSSTFTGNQAYDSCLAGAIYSIGNLNVRNSSFVNNAKEAIMNAGGNLIVENSQFINNAAYSGSGGAICSWGSLEINRCSFINNTARMGGAIQNGGSIVVLDSEFVNNSATNWEYGGRGGAIDTGVYSTVEYSLIDNCTFTGNSAYTYDQWHYGGAVYNNAGNLTIANCTFNDNVARGYGGAIFNQAEGNLTVAGCNFFDNFVYLGPSVVVERGGNVLYNSGGHVELHFNRIIGSGDVIGNRVSYRYVEAQNNWWGSNNSPGGKVDDGVHYNPWIVLNVTASPTSISKYETSIIIADLTHNSNGTYYDPAVIHVPDGMQISFITNLGTLNPTNSTIINGTSNTTFTGNIQGIATVNATVDVQTVNTQIIVINNDIYVATTGNDTTGDGSQGNPYESISKGVFEVSSGGMVHIANGTYTGTLNKNINITRNLSIFGEKL